MEIAMIWECTVQGYRREIINFSVNVGESAVLQATCYYMTVDNDDV